MDEVILIGGMTLATFIVRYPILAMFSRITLPPALVRALRYVPVAVLTAISVPEMVFRNGAPALNFANAHLIAGLIAILIAWYTKKLLPTILIGMGIFLAIRVINGM